MKQFREILNRILCAVIWLLPIVRLLLLQRIDKSPAGSETTEPVEEDKKSAEDHHNPQLQYHSEGVY